MLTLLQVDLLIVFELRDLAHVPILQALPERRQLGRVVIGWWFGNLLCVKTSTILVLSIYNLITVLNQIWRFEEWFLANLSS